MVFRAIDVACIAGNEHRENRDAIPHNGQREKRHGMPHNGHREGISIPNNGQNIKQALWLITRKNNGIGKSRGRHGKCCECVAHHKEHGKKLPACLRGIEWER